MPVNHYSVYGLAVASELECPELIATDPPVRTDVEISLAEIPALLDAPLHVIRQVQIGDGVFQFEPLGVARYRAVGGRTILVQPFPDASPEEVRLFLLGTVFGALLHQQGRLPLHASGVEWAGGAVAFCGPSGAGKSTLAAALHRRGHPLLCDDVGVVVPDAEGTPLFYPAFPRIKLWRDALDHFALDPTVLSRDWIRAEKYHLQLHDTFHRRPLPLRRIYFLERGEAGEPAVVQSVGGARGVALLVANTYRGGQVRRTGDFQTHFTRCARVAEKVFLRRYIRPWSLAGMEASLDTLADDVSLTPSLPG
ncbi:hypothetical protein T8K17_25580 (plasmid) [Thalassobaculum sp. OXR-137]|uniref:hypothetical protein n=1 Tax=Thalassobaculum sp. OXR-137 TaxID=3100173 RepID=UPI002AC9A7D7|nr:hypothetical protein [Thalassobaculum sp. OXR-137]WPZ37254.1 hypothetical protein T8K17_25580 [Thalassobaculum sp. OXR-137]